MDELRPCSHMLQNFYDSTTSVFLSPPPGASSTGMLASRPTGLGVPPPWTTIADACTPLSSAAEGDKWRPTWVERTVSDLQITQLLPTGYRRMLVMGRGETPAQQQPHSTSGDDWQVRFNTLSVNVIIRLTGCQPMLKIRTMETRSIDCRLIHCWM